VRGGITIKITGLVGVYTDGRAHERRLIDHLLHDLRRAKSAALAIRDIGKTAVLQ